MVSTSISIGKEVLNFPLTAALRDDNDDDNDVDNEDDDDDIDDDDNDDEVDAIYC